MSPDQTPRGVEGAKRVYRKLLRLYPLAFRRQFGGQMEQLFEDQCREALGRAGMAPRINFWTRTLSDLFRSVLAERWLEARASGWKRAANLKPVGVFLRVFVYSSLLLAFCTPSLSRLLQPVYVSVARISFEEPAGKVAADHTRVMESRIVGITSTAVLDQVVKELRLAEQYGDMDNMDRKALATPEAFLRLKKNVTARYHPQTGLLELRAASVDRELAATIAYHVAYTYLRVSGEKISLVDPPQPPPRRWRPLIPEVFLKGVAACLILALFCSWSLWLLKRGNFRAA